jgi:acetyl esterase/lipase
MLEVKAPDTDGVSAGEARTVRVRSLLIACVLLAVAVACLAAMAGVTRSARPTWCAEQFARYVGRGPAGLAMFAAWVLLVVPAALLIGVARLDRTSRRAGRRVLRSALAGAGCGMLIALYQTFAQVVVPFVGERFAPPGSTVAARYWGDGRYARLVGGSAVVNACAGAVLGTLLFAALARVGLWSMRVPLLLASLAVAGIIAERNAGDRRPAGAERGALLAVFQAAPTIDVRRDLPFATRGGAHLLADLFVPRRSRPTVAAVCIHGGGWHGGSREEQWPTAAWLASRGCAALTIDYRLAPRDRHPAQVEDVRAGVRWLREHAAEIGLPAGAPVIAVGWSAGGHLACLAGLSRVDAEDERVQGIVAFAPLTDLTDAVWQRVPNSAALLLGPEARVGRETYREASPIAHVRGISPPTVLFHARDDRVVPAEQSRALCAALRTAGAWCELRMAEGEGHRWSGRRLEAALDDALAVLIEAIDGRAAGGH